MTTEAGRVTALTRTPSARAQAQPRRQAAITAPAANEDGDPWFDPGGKLRDALARLSAGESLELGPEELLLLWLVGLPDPVDPAMAADALLRRHPRLDAASEGAPARLGLLLQETARFPRERLATMPRRGRAATREPVSDGGDA